MAYRRYIIRSEVSQCSPHNAYWYWRVTLNGEEYVDGITYSEAQATASATFATEYAERNYNRGSITPDLDTPWY